MNNIGKDSQRKKDILNTHPCLSAEAHGKYARIHLPVAPACNINCRYCERKYDCVSESRPGVTSRVLSPREAVERVIALSERNERLRVIGVAGPGDPLANEGTFEFFSAARRELPHLTFCASTNGLLLTDRINDLVECGVQSLTITINAVTPATAEAIYSWITIGGRRFQGFTAAERLIASQWAGAMLAVKAGLLVKINTIYIPGVNNHEIPVIAARAGNIGVEIMNVMPLIPQAGFSHLKRPSCRELDLMRAECGKHVKQMVHCTQCRADAFGLLGEDGDMDLELVNAGIGEDYCEMVS